MEKDDGGRGTQARHEGHSGAGGVEKDVTFVEEADTGINDQIDAAYRKKYRGDNARFVEPVVGPEARAATIKLVPRQATWSGALRTRDIGTARRRPRR